jgi:transposase
MLLTGYQTPAAIRRVGAARLERWLAARKTRNAPTLARRAVEAATSQHIRLPGEALTAQIVQTLAQGILALHAQIAEIDKLIEARFRQHADAAIIESLPGFGPLLGAEFLAITGGDMTRFETPDRLAGMAGLAPYPATPAASPGISTGRSATTEACNASSTTRP